MNTIAQCKGRSQAFCSFLSVFLSLFHLKKQAYWDRCSYISRNEVFYNPLCLPTAFPTMPFPQAFGRRFAQSIAGGWFATVPTVLRNLVFQGLNANQEFL